MYSVIIIDANRLISLLHLQFGSYLINRITFKVQFVYNDVWLIYVNEKKEKEKYYTLSETSRSSSYWFTFSSPTSKYD